MLTIYTVVVPFWHRGQLRAAGAELLLTEAEARYLLIGGSIRAADVEAPHAAQD